MEQTVPKMLKDSAGKWPEIPAQYFKNAAGTFSFLRTKSCLKSPRFRGRPFIARH